MQTQAAQDTLSGHKPQVFIGRQPIFDAKLNVVGYELLFRPGNVNAFDGSDGNKLRYLTVHSGRRSTIYCKNYGIPLYVPYQN